jgi:hypothetical protein
VQTGTQTILDQVEIEVAVNRTQAVHVAMVHKSGLGFLKYCLELDQRTSKRECSLHAANNSMN